MFQGTTLITLDDKGRLALPKRARDEAAADGVIVAARHPDGCLVLYPPSAWAPKRDALLKLPFSARGFVRLVLGSAEELKVDRAGRVLIPAGLRELAGLEREAALVGWGDHFELWDRARLTAAEAQAVAQTVEDLDFTFCQRKYFQNFGRPAQCFPGASSAAALLDSRKRNKPCPPSSIFPF